MKDTLIPAFRRGYRLQWEAAQQSHVVLYPEGMAKLNETAAASTIRGSKRRGISTSAAA
ncbi:pyrroloquinoline quinone biosynthesis peptide chaperone PqqD [Pantoea sp. BRM17]|nr:pyrroloquinoline quinone biosynthesis peptide chaperone PqqD [Pantoea sp. BRM17]